MKLKITVIISIIILMILPITHGALSVYKDLKEQTPETEISETVSIEETN